MRKHLLITLTILMAATQMAVGQKYLKEPHPFANVRPIETVEFAGNNMVSIGGSFGIFDYDPAIHLRAEYIRQFTNKHFSIGVSLMMPMTHYLLADRDETWNSYYYKTHMIFAGTVYYRAFLNRRLSLCFGVGLGAGYFIYNKAGREAGLNNALIPYLNLSAHWVIMLGKRGELRLPLLFLPGPGVFGIPMTRENLEDDWLYCDIMLSISYGFRF